MHAFIITGGTQISRALFVTTLNTIQTELIHIETEKTSITIKQIQDLSAPLAISPRLSRIVWIEEANLLTVPAQNALLKMLEEPPQDTNFYLTCLSKSALLPTINSRAKNITLGTEDSPSDPTILSELKQVMAMSPGDRLASIVKRDRAESIVWITQIEQALRSVLLGSNLSDSSYQTMGKIAQSAISAHIEYASNCSIGLVTQNFYLTLPHTHSAR